MYLVAFFLNFFLLSLNIQQNHHHFPPQRLPKERWGAVGGAVRVEGEAGPLDRLASERARSVQAAAPQVVGDDDVGDGVEHHLDVSRVCGAGHVTVDLLVGRAVLALKLSLDVGRRVLVGVGPCSGGRAGHFTSEPRRLHYESLARAAAR